MNRRPPRDWALGGLRVAVIAVVFVDLVEVLFDPPASLFLFGVTNGALYGLAAVGVILVYRVHRVINFAAVAIGALPAVTAMLLVVVEGLSYWAALALSLAGGIVVAGAMEIVVVRRFAGGSRLLLTIATLAVVQVLALVSERVAARVVTDRAVPPEVPSPWRGWAWTDSRGIPILTGDQVAAIVAVLVTGAVLAYVLRYTRTGIALRATGDNVARAHLFGLPVRRLQTLAWMIAGFIAAITVFFRIPLVGVPLDPTLGADVTLYVVAAAVVARLTSIPVAVAAGVAIGILEQASIAQVGSADLTGVLVLGLLVVALLLQRRPESRALEADDGSWRGVAEPRPMPAALRRLPTVRAARMLAGAAVAGVAVTAPYIVSPGQLGKLTLIPLTAIVGVSLVVLTGWAGQVSLGQFALAGVGAGIAGGLAANHQADFFVALAAGVVAGATVAVLVGLPAARVRGIYLAVTTLALATAMESYILKQGHPVHRWLLPHGEAPRVERPALFGRIDLANDRTFYFVSVAFLVAAVLLARSFRHSRSGRVVLASRDNRPAAVTFGINPAAARIAAFALAGALAALGGSLLAYQQGSVDAGAYGAAPSVVLFLAVVLGGITSPMGALLGVTALKGVQYFLEPHLTDAALLFDGPLLLFVLLVNPGGISAGITRVRDRWFARAAARPRTPTAAGDDVEPMNEAIAVEMVETA